MKKEFEIIDNSHIFYMSEKKDDYYIDPAKIKKLLKLIEGYEPIDGLVISDSTENDYAARISAVYHEATFVPYASSQRMSIQEYIDMGEDRGPKLMELDGRVWELTKWDNLIDTVTKEKYPLTLEQKIAIGNSPLWEIIGQLDNGKTVCKEGAHYGVVHGENGSGLYVYYLNDDNEIVTGPNRGEGSRVLAIKKNGEDIWINVEEAFRSKIDRRHAYYGTLVSILRKIYEEHSIDGSDTSCYVENLANFLLWKGIDDELLEASMKCGGQIDTHIMRMAYDVGRGVSFLSTFGKRFSRGSFPERIQNDVLLATPGDDMEDMIYGGNFLEIYENGPGNRAIIIVKVEDKRYAIDNTKIAASLRKIGKNYVMEYDLYKSLQ